MYICLVGNTLEAHLPLAQVMIDEGYSVLILESPAEILTAIRQYLPTLFVVDGDGPLAALALAWLQRMTNGDDLACLPRVVVMQSEDQPFAAPYQRMRRPRTVLEMRDFFALLIGWSSRGILLQ